MLNNFKFTKYGKFMFNLCHDGAIFLAKHRWLYYILACTWGILLTLPGIIITLTLLIIGKKPKKYGGIYYFQVGKYWGGFEMGLMFVRDTTSWDSVNSHELGHSYQNAILGPFMPFLVSIPSAIRYWYRQYTKKALPAYDAIWFEGNATFVGEKIILNYFSSSNR